MCWRKGSISAFLRSGSLGRSVCAFNWNPPWVYAEHSESSLGFREWPLAIRKSGCWRSWAIWGTETFREVETSPIVAGRNEFGVLQWPRICVAHMHWAATVQHTLNRWSLTSLIRGGTHYRMFAEEKNQSVYQLYLTHLKSINRQQAAQAHTDTHTQAEQNEKC